MEQKKARTVRRRREDWLRRSGLALVLPPRVRARSLIVRTAPMMLVVFIEFVALALTWRLESSLKGRDIDDLAITDGLVSLAFVAVVLVLGYLGFGSMLGWLARRGAATFASVGPMVTRAMPVLVMATMFFFFNAEIWQLATNVSIRRALLIGVGLLALAVVVVVVAMRDARSSQPVACRAR